MANGISPLGEGDRTVSSATTRRAQASEPGAARFTLPPPEDVPATPPPEVLAALDGAARVHRELHAHGLSVAFDVQDEGDVRVSVVDDSGNVVRELAPSRALALLHSARSIQELSS